MVREGCRAGVYDFDTASVRVGVGGQGGSIVGWCWDGMGDGGPVGAAAQVGLAAAEMDCWPPGLDRGWGIATARVDWPGPDDDGLDWRWII